MLPARTASQLGAGKLLRSLQRAAEKQGRPVPSTLEEALATSAEHRAAGAAAAVHGLPAGSDPKRAYNLLVGLASAGREARVEVRPPPSAVAAKRPCPPPPSVPVVAAGPAGAGGDVVVIHREDVADGCHYVSCENYDLQTLAKAGMRKVSFQVHDTCQLCHKQISEAHLASSAHEKSLELAASLDVLCGQPAFPRQLNAGAPVRANKLALARWWGKDVGKLHEKTAMVYQSRGSGNMVTLKCRSHWARGYEVPRELVKPCFTGVVSYTGPGDGMYIKKNGVFKERRFLAWSELPEGSGDGSNEGEEAPDGMTWWPVVAFALHQSLQVPTELSGCKIIWIDCVYYILLRNHEIWAFPLRQAPVPVVATGPGPQAALPTPPALPPPPAAVPGSGAAWGNFDPYHPAWYPPSYAASSAGTSTTAGFTTASAATGGGVWDDAASSRGAPPSEPAPTVPGSGPTLPGGGASSSQELTPPPEPAPTIPGSGTSPQGGGASSSAWVGSSGWGSSGWGSSSGWDSSSWSGGGWGSSGW